MMTRRSGRPVYAFVTSLVAVGLTVGACNDSATDPGSTADGMALVTVLLTDNPGVITEAWVQIDEIYLQGHSESDGSNGDMDHAGRFPLLEDPTGWINLLELDGETLTLVEGVLISEGFYSQLRFVVGEVLLVTSDGTFATSGVDSDLVNALNGVRSGDDLTFPEGGFDLLHCPSCSQSGLKVKFTGEGPLEIAEGSEILVLDFDADQSFGHIAGQSGRWIMHPVILGDALEAGTP